MPKTKDPTLTRDEWASVREAAAFDPPVLAILKVCHATGTRLAEALWLNWADVDLEAGTVAITEKPGEWRPKTDSALRTVHARELVEWLCGAYRTSLDDRRASVLAASGTCGLSLRWDGR